MLAVEAVRDHPDAPFRAGVFFPSAAWDLGYYWLATNFLAFCHRELPFPRSCPLLGQPTSSDCPVGATKASLPCLDSRTLKGHPIPVN